MSNTRQTNERLFEIIKKRSFQKGTFTLASGKKSSYYLDCRLTTLDAEGAFAIGQLFYDNLASYHLDAVGGMTMGADPIISSILFQSAQTGFPLKGFIVRKDVKGYGAKKQIEGHLEPWMRVALVEDVITTGGSTLKAIQAIKAVFPTVEIVKVLAIVDRQEGASEKFNQLGIPFEALFHVDAFLKE